MSEPELRKIQLTGGTTYAVFLPKEWAKQAGIHPKSQVTLMPLDDLSILIIPRVETNKKKSKIEAKFLRLSVFSIPFKKVILFHH